MADGGRNNCIDLDDYFMSVAYLVAKRSRDPSTQVGACIVDQDERVVGIGYNRMPRDCDGKFPWTKEENADPLDTKRPYVSHAELNAILNKTSFDVRGCKIYVSLFPCNECAKLIIQSGIKEVIYYCDKYHKKDIYVASRKLLETAGIVVTKFEPKEKKHEIDFDSIM